MSEELSEEAFWKGMIKKYWVGFLILLLVCVGFFIWFFTILLTYIANSDIGGNGLWTLDDFSVGTSILWLLSLIGWELLLGFLPFGGIFCLILAIYWFVILPEEDKEAIKARESKDKKKKRTKESGGVSFLFTIAFLIVVFIDGNWLTPFGSLPYSYLIQAYLIGFIWVCIIAAIPAVIIFLYWISKETDWGKKKSE